MKRKFTQIPRGLIIIISFSATPRQMTICVFCIVSKDDALVIIIMYRYKCTIVDAIWTCDTYYIYIYVIYYHAVESALFIPTQWYKIIVLVILITDFKICNNNQFNTELNVLQLKKYSIAEEYNLKVLILQQ